MAPVWINEYPLLRILPPVVAIVFAVILRDVVFSLLLAVVCGCLLLTDCAAYPAIEKTCEAFVAQLADSSHASIILFTVLLGSMVGLMQDSGGTTAVVNRITQFADTRRKGQILTWLGGLVVFFDDYANTMLIGNSVRQLTDRLKISRAKLAFLVDATAAPVAGLALSTWTAFEIGEIKTGIEGAQATANVTANAITLFVATIPYRIYPILAICLVGAVAVSGRDIGPMLKAERNASSTPDEQTTTRSLEGGSVWTAIFPLLVLIGTVVALILHAKRTGGPEWWGEADPNQILLITSMAASTAAAGAALVFRRLTLRECSESWVRGITSMVPAVTVLLLAWAVNWVCAPEQLDTAQLIASALGGLVRLEFFPAACFVVAGAMAVSIGSSFATMGLMLPMVIPITAGLLNVESGADVSLNPIMLATVGAILAGAIFGDHCSPISDTTVLSSAAADCDHLHHVATQVPYALIAAACSLLFGYIPIGFGVPWWLALPVAAGTCIGVILLFGQKPDTHKPGKA